MSKAVRNVLQIKRNQQHQPTSIIIPAAGEGIRMRSVGTRSLISLGNKTLIEHQIELIRNIYVNCQIILVSGFEANRLMNKAPKGIVCIENERYAETNVLRSIGIGLRASIYENVLIVYGDLIFNQEVLNTNTNKSHIIYEDSDVISETEIGCTINEKSKLENVFYGIPNRWLSIMYLTGRELKLMKGLAFDKQKEKLYGWEAINEIIDKGGEFQAVSPKNAKCIDVDSTKDMEKVKLVL